MVEHQMLYFFLILVLLLLLELVYFRVANHFNIIDKPNERSSHSSIVLRGGGVIFALSSLVWVGLQLINGNYSSVIDYLPFLMGLLLISSISFIDDIISLPDSVRLVAQFIAMGLMFYALGILQWNLWWVILSALIICVGATNIINFMDGINGITAGYSLAVLLPLYLLNNYITTPFIDDSFITIVILSIIVFCIFNFRPKGKAKCFAGDVGSISIAFLMLFIIGKLIVQTQDITYLIFLLVYGVDGCLTICHRIMLKENLGEAHRKHAYQLMANELHIGHVKVSLLYMIIQTIISLGFIYICRDTLFAHWIYLIVSLIILSLAYILFMRKYYHLHEEYLASIKK